METERKKEVADDPNYSSMDIDLQEQENIWPVDFRCPISMELMEDPVTICTGVTYDRKNIEKWLFTYKKTTCPATMQSIPNFDVTPNHTLKRLILDWFNRHQYRRPPYNNSSSCSRSVKHDENNEMVSVLLQTIHSSPFKVTTLKKLRSLLETGDGDYFKKDFIRSGGVELLVHILVQVLVVEGSEEFVTFRACEEALGVLHILIPLSSISVDESRQDQEREFRLLSKPESMKSMAIVLQRGSAEARLYTIAIFQKMSKNDNVDWNLFIRDEGVGFFKSLLELVSDEISSKASTCALDVLLEILASSKKSRTRAIEAGAVCVLIELLPDSSGSKCEKKLLLIKLLCECAEGRLALVEHAMGIAVVSKKLLHVSNTATKLGVKILWLICSFQHTEKVLEELLICGSLKKLVRILHMDGRSTTKEKVIKMFKLHGNSWRRYPCFPCELKDYLGN